MQSLANSLHRTAASLGGTGVLGVGVLVFCGAFYVSTLQPAEQHLSEVHAQLARQGRQRPPVLDEDPAYSREALGSFYAFFPPSEHLSDQIRKIYAVAEKQSFQLEQGEYRASRDNTGRLLRYQISLPIRGNYTQVRKFLAGVLADVPYLSVESIQFERHRASETTVDAKVKLVMYLGSRS